MNTYVWAISALDCIPNVDGKTDYVVTSHWTCTGTDGTFTGFVCNMATFNVSAKKANYIPYANLTETEVIAWTQAALGNETVTATYASIDAQIENQVNPPIVTPPLPWAVSA